MPLRTPQLAKRTALLRKLKEVFRRSRSQAIRGMIEEINLIRRGWVHYFAVGHSSRCFSFVREWTEKKVRRHLAKARQRQGSAGSGGVRNGYMRNSVSFMTTESVIYMPFRKRLQLDRPHNP